MLRLHALNVGGKARPVAVARAAFVRALKAHDFRDFVAVCVVAVQAFFHRAVECGNKFIPFFDCRFFIVRRVFRFSRFIRRFSHLFEFGKQFFYRLRFNRLKHAVLLQNLAADVERQILRIDNAAHKTQIRRKQLAVVVRNKYALNVEFYAAFVVRLIHIERSALRYEEKRRVFLRAFRVRVNVHERVFADVSDCLVKLVVVGGFQFRLRLFPKCRRAVYLVDFVFGRLDVAFVVVLILRVVQVNGECNVVAVAFDKLFDFPAARVLFAVVV